MFLKYLSTVVSVFFICEMQNVSCISERIVGGQPVQDYVPYQVSLQIKTPKKYFELVLSNYSHTCGGSIINENYILTAAHCIYTNISRYSVLAGTPNLLDTSGQRRDIDYCIRHPNFVSILSTDIAICKLLSPLVFDQKVGKIEMETEMVGAGVNCTLTGWGSLSIYRTMNISYYNLMAYPMFLQTINLPTISNEQCNQMYKT